MFRDEYNSDDDESIHTIQSLRSVSTIDPCAVTSVEDIAYPAMSLVDVRAHLIDDDSSSYSDEDVQSVTKVTKVTNIRKSETLKYYSKFMEDFDFDPRQHRWSTTPPGWGESARFGSTIKDWLCDAISEDVYFPAPEPVAKVTPRERTKTMKTMSTITETNDVFMEVPAEVKVVKNIITRSGIPRSTERTVMGAIDSIVNVEVPLDRKEKSAIDEKASPSATRYSLSKNNHATLSKRPDISHLSALARAKGTRPHMPVPSRVGSNFNPLTAPHHMKGDVMPDPLPSKDHSSSQSVYGIAVSEIANIPTRTKRSVPISADESIKRTGVVVDSHSPYAIPDSKSNTHTSVSTDSETPCLPINTLAVDSSDQDAEEMKDVADGSNEEGSQGAGKQPETGGNADNAGKNRSADKRSDMVGSDDNADDERSDDGGKKIVSTKFKPSFARSGGSNCIRWYYFTICPVDPHSQQGHQTGLDPLLGQDRCRDLCVPPKCDPTFLQAEILKRNDTLSIKRDGDSYGSIKFAAQADTATGNPAHLGEYWCLGIKNLYHENKFVRDRPANGCFSFVHTSSGKQYIWPGCNIDDTEYFCERLTAPIPLNPNRTKQIVAFLGKKGDWCETQKTKKFKVVVSRKKGKGWLLGVRDIITTEAQPECAPFMHTMYIDPAGPQTPIDQCFVKEEFLIGVACMLMQRKAAKKGWAKLMDDRRLIRIGYAGFTYFTSDDDLLNPQVRLEMNHNGTVLVTGVAGK
jgi:hypothetical protein